MLHSYRERINGVPAPVMRPGPAVLKYSKIFVASHIIHNSVIIRSKTCCIMMTVLRSNRILNSWGAKGIFDTGIITIMTEEDRIMKKTIIAAMMAAGLR